MARIKSVPAVTYRTCVVTFSDIFEWRFKSIEWDRMSRLWIELWTCVGGCKIGILKGFPILLCEQDYHHARHQSVCQFPEWISAWNHFYKGKGKGKGKIHPITGHQGPEVECRYKSILSLTSALDRGGWTTPHPGRFTPEEDPVPIA